MSKRSSSSRTFKKLKTTTTTREGKEHPLLQFQDPTHVTRYNGIKDRVIDPNRYLDFDNLESVGLRNTIECYLTNAGMYQTAQIRENCYKELFLEFMSTFELDKQAIVWKKDKVMHFRLGGRHWHMSFAEFGVGCGFYGEEYVNGECFRDALYEFPSNVVPNNFWCDITYDPDDPRCENMHTTRYYPHKSKGSLILEPALRVIHKFIAHSIYGRKGSSSVVSLHDLLLLYCMVHSIPINLGRCFATYIQHQLNSTRGGALTGGSYITMLAKNLGVFKGYSRFIQHRMEPIDLNTLLNMRMVKKHGNGYILCEANEHEEEEIQRNGEEATTDVDTDDQPPNPSQAIPNLRQMMTKGIDEVKTELQFLRRQQERIQGRQLWMQENLIRYFQLMQFEPTPPPEFLSPSSP